MTFIEIEEAKKEIYKMKKALEYPMPDDRKEKLTARINTFIRLINASERLVENSCDKDMIDAMLLHVFKLRYDAEDTSPEVGFISEIAVELIRDTMAFDFALGAAGVKKMLVEQITLDAMACSSVLTEEEKELSPSEWPIRMVQIYNNNRKMWSANLDYILEKCHDKRKGVWKN